MNGQPKRYISRKHLAKRWDCSVRHLEDRARRGEEPKPHRIGGRLIRYCLDEIERLEAND